MPIAVSCKHLLHLGCGLFIFSAMTAHPTLAQPKKPGTEEAFQINQIKVRPPTDEQIRQFLMDQKFIEKMRPIDKPSNSNWSSQTGHAGAGCSMPSLRWAASAAAGAQNRFSK
jgi:hypothetical protein